VKSVGVRWGMKVSLAETGQEVRFAEAHLSNDEAVAKMGHPGFGGGFWLNILPNKNNLDPLTFEFGVGLLN
jgi:hypothetical protein